MLIALPLLSALSMTPALANSFSGSEKRTLQSAISSVLHSDEINRYYQLCKEQPEENQELPALTDKERPRLLALLQQKLKTADTDLLFNLDPRITQSVRNGLVKPVNCDDTKGLQTLLDNYEVALFSLDLALPLERSLTQKSGTKSRSNAVKAEASQLINQSHAIALVDVVDKQQLNAVQQANYLHPDYSGKYIFKVQQGWRSNIPYYLGMHIFVSDTEFDKTPKQWLVFLDKNGHFIKAIPSSSAAVYIKALEGAEWRYDVYGNLHRN